MLRILRFLALLFLSLVLGTSYSHLLQWAPKASLPASDFLTIHQVLLSQYGIGIGWIEGITVIMVGFVAFLVRSKPRQLSLALLSLLCLIAMVLIWAIWINSINMAVDSWSVGSIPQNWQNVRDSWHQFHAVRFALATVAFGTFAGTAIMQKEPSSTRCSSPSTH